jgi:hypothetical protein
MGTSGQTLQEQDKSFRGKSSVAKNVSSPFLHNMATWFIW